MSCLFSPSKELKIKYHYGKLGCRAYYKNEQRIECEAFYVKTQLIQQINYKFTICYNFLKILYFICC